MLPGAPASYWIESTPASSYPPLREDLEVDVAVVGGGIAGISTAWEVADRPDRGTAGGRPDRRGRHRPHHRQAVVAAHAGLLADRPGARSGRRPAVRRVAAVGRRARRGHRGPARCGLPADR